MRSGDAGTYLATGVDGAYTMFDEHLTLSGFYARSATSGQAAGGMGEAEMTWATQDYNARLAYLDVGSTFDAQLGFVPIVGARTTTASAYYTPIVQNDLVQQVFLGAQIDRARTADEALVYDRGFAEATAVMLDGSQFSVRVMPSIEGVAQSFPLFANRVTVPAGRYDVNVVQVFASTPPRRTLEASVQYTEGDLFGGYRRSPAASLTLNLDRLAANVQYQVYFVRYVDARLTGHQLSARATYSYTPLARTTLAVEANTLTLRSIVQLVTSWQFGALSTVAFVIGESTGITPDHPEVARWYDRPDWRATLSFAYGVTPF